MVGVSLVVRRMTISFDLSSFSSMRIFCRYFFFHRAKSLHIFDPSRRKTKRKTKRKRARDGVLSVSSGGGDDDDAKVAFVFFSFSEEEEEGLERREQREHREEEEEETSSRDSRSGAIIIDT